MPPLYETVAEELARHIAEGVYPAGSRLPGVRNVAAARGVSVATVVAAYRQLEDAGQIEARPRSGFYVRPRPPLRPLAPEPAPRAEPPCLVNGRDMAMALLKASHDPRIVQLGAAVPAPEFLPTQAVSQALARATRLHRARAAGYMMPPGAPELRREIARRMQAAGARIDADDIVVTTGCQEALSLALRAVTKPGDVVAVESPAFYGLLHVMESLGLEVLEIPAHPAEGISLDALAFALDQWPVKACVAVPNFSNPLGFLMPDANKQALVALLARHGIPLIEDDVYGDLGFAARRPSTCMALVPEADVLYCGSFSKTLAPGLRIGWIAAPCHHEAVEYLKYVSSIASPSAPQFAVADLLASGRYERYLREARGKYASAVARMSDAVMRHFPEGTRVSQPQGGFVLWVELPETVDSFALARRALKAGVSIAPGPLFSASGKYRHHIRLSCARVWDAPLERAVMQLGAFVSEGKT